MGLRLFRGLSILAMVVLALVLVSYLIDYDTTNVFLKGFLKKKYFAGNSFIDTTSPSYSLS
jgi:hypothetical protein